MSGQQSNQQGSHTSKPSRPRKDWLEFDKSDRVAFRVMVWGGVAVTFLLNVVEPVLSWLRGGSLQVPYGSEIVVPELDRVGTEYTVGEYAILVTDPTTGDRLLDLVPGLLVVGLFVVGALLIQRIVRDIARGEPFAPAQVGRLRWLAGLLVVGTIVVGFVGVATKGMILAGQNLGELNLAVSVQLALAPIFAGFGLALLAEAFKVGRQLRDDVDGLI